MRTPQCWQWRKGPGAQQHKECRSRSWKRQGEGSDSPWSLERASKSESRSVVSDSLRPHVLYSPWNSPGQNTGGGSLSCLQGIFPTQGSRIAGEFFTAEPPGKPKNTGVGSLILSVADLHNPGIELGSPALQVDSLAELPGKPKVV